MRGYAADMRFLTMCFEHLYAEFPNSNERRIIVEGFGRLSF